MAQEVTGGGMPIWGKREEIAPFSPVDGLEMRVVTGERMMTVWVRIEPHKVMPVHHHPNEQIGLMIEGELEMTIGDETHLLRAGDSYVIPPDLPHGAVTHDSGCLVLDVFAPTRQDYLEKARAAADQRSIS